MMVVLEKSPAEMGKLFEVISALIKEKMPLLVPLKLKLESNYNAYHRELLKEIDEKKLIKALDKLDKPVGFNRKKLIAKEDLEQELRDLLKERDDMTHQKDVAIVEEISEIKNRIKLLPIKLGKLLKGYGTIRDMMAPNGFITTVFAELENSSGKVDKLRKTEKWKKCVNTRLRFGSLIYKLQMAWRDAWETTDELEFNNHMNEFELLMVQILKFKDLEMAIEKSPVEELVSLGQITELYRQIEGWTLEFEKIVVKISSNKELKRLVRQERKHLVDLDSEQKRLQIKIDELKEPIEKLEDNLNGKLYVLDVFWNYVVLEYEEFPNNIKKLLQFGEFNYWLDARNKYEVYLKMRYVLESSDTMFDSLVGAYNQAMSNLRQAKRNFSRYKDRATKLTLEKCTLRPVLINQDENSRITDLILLCSRLDKVDTYIDNSNLFLGENQKLVTTMYRENALTMDMWTDLFTRLMQGES